MIQYDTNYLYWLQYMTEYTMCVNNPSHWRKKVIFANIYSLNYLWFYHHMIDCSYFQMAKHFDIQFSPEVIRLYNVHILVWNDALRCCTFLALWGIQHNCFQTQDIIHWFCTHVSAMIWSLWWTMFTYAMASRLDYIHAQTECQENAKKSQ